jgi:hypothetical protein
MLLLATSVFLTCVCSASSGKGALSWQQRHVAAVHWHARTMISLYVKSISAFWAGSCSASPAWTRAYRVYGYYSFEFVFLSCTYVAALIEPTYLMKAVPKCGPSSSVHTPHVRTAADGWCGVVFCQCSWSGTASPAALCTHLAPCAW